MRSKKRGCSLRMSLPTMIRRSARLRVSVRVDVVQPALCSTLTLRYCAFAQGMIDHAAGTLGERKRRAHALNVGGKPAKQGTVGLADERRGFLDRFGEGDVLASDLRAARRQLAFEAADRPPAAVLEDLQRAVVVRSTSRSSHSMPQNGQATFSNTFCISRSPAALRALEFCMPLEPHHKAREESTGGTATQLQGRNLSPLAVAQIGQDSKLRCSRGRPARHRPRPRLCCGRDLNNLERRPCPRAMAVWPTFSGFC